MILQFTKWLSKSAEKAKNPFLKPILDALDHFFRGSALRQNRPPFIRDRLDIKRFMVTPILFLLPLVLSAVYFYGLRALLMIGVSYAAGGAVEVIFAGIRKKEIEEGFLVTGMIFPLTLPPGTPLWVVAVGIVFGVFFGKEVFGGTGRNIFNPALVGRIFITFAFPSYLATSWAEPALGGYGALLSFDTQALSGATPLASGNVDLFSLLLGLAPGSLGETMRALIIVCGVLLLFTRVANWRIPLSALFSLLFFGLILHGCWPGYFAPPLYQLLSGAFLFGIFFMATDPVTGPFTSRGKIIAGGILGLLVLFIRAFSVFPEGVMFSILFVNGLSPLLDQMVLAREKKRWR